MHGKSEVVTLLFRVLLCSMLLLPLLTACAVQMPADSGSEASATTSATSEKVPEKDTVTPLSIRNSTDRGGFAVLVSEHLRSKGYLSQNGYTIDIGNAKATECKRSVVWVPSGNEELYAEALELNKVLNFSLVSGDDALGEREGADGKGILIILGIKEAETNTFDEYADSSDPERDYPVIPYSDRTTIFQVEPFDAAAAKELNEHFEAANAAPTRTAVHLSLYNANGVDGSATAAAVFLTEHGYSPEILQTAQSPQDRVTILYQNASFEAEAREIGALLGAEEYICIADYPGWGYIKDDVCVKLGLNWVNANMLKEGQEPYPSCNYLL